MSTGIAIRPSQFVLNYGVGSIIEGSNGPRIITDFKRWGRFFNSRDLELKLTNNYEILDGNLSMLLDGGKIFRLPTNSDLLETDDKIIFSTKPFPNWATCLEHGYLFKIGSNGKTRCPRCHPTKDAQAQASRFIRACPNGHLDDINWFGILHRNHPGCKNDFFEWRETGSTLEDIKIRCKCGAEVTMRDVYYGTHDCSGRIPEQDIFERCNEKATVILRNASNIRISELLSVLTIHPRDTNIGRILENPKLYALLGLYIKRSWNKKELIDNLKVILDTIPNINLLTINELEKAPDELLNKTISDIVSRYQSREKISPNKMRELELDALKTAVKYGHPPEPEKISSDFIVEKDTSNIIPLSEKISIRATPIKKLRVVIAQKGYRRIVGKSQAKLMETYLNIGQDRWYIGISLLGEGIFIDMPENQKIVIKKETCRDWVKLFNSHKNFSYHPSFVWWHTLSHRIIKALGIDSGYSSAAIRERIYLKYDEGSSEVNSAILLYTSQRGGDGTLGGLISLVPDFSRIVNIALRDIDSCSNDPLCSEQQLTLSRNNGAACYACLFTSETSCEYGNYYLDRNLLRSNIF